MPNKVTPLPLDPNRLLLCHIGGRTITLVIPPITANPKKTTRAEVILISAKAKKREKR